MRTTLQHHSARSRTHVVFRCRHSSNAISCHDSRLDLASLGSVEHVRVDDPLCRRFLGLTSSRGHTSFLYPCGLFVGSSDFQTPVQNLTIVVVTKLTGCVKNTFTSGRQTYSPHCVLILIASPDTSTAYLPMAESNKAWVNGKRIV